MAVPGLTPTFPTMAVCAGIGYRGRTKHRETLRGAQYGCQQNSFFTLLKRYRGQSISARLRRDPTVDEIDLASCPERKPRKVIEGP